MGNITGFNVSGPVVLGKRANPGGKVKKQQWQNVVLERIVSVFNENTLPDCSCYHNWERIPKENSVEEDICRSAINILALELCFKFPYKFVETFWLRELFSVLQSRRPENDVRLYMKCLVCHFRPIFMKFGACRQNLLLPRISGTVIPGII
jgi:ribosomal protein S14